jgi:uncharacterized protein
MLIRTLLAALAGGVVLDRLNIPAGSLIGAMVGVAAVNLLGSQAVGPPSVLRFAAFLVIGWELGAQIEHSAIEQMRGAIVPILVVVGGLLATGALLAIILHTAGLDPITAFLSAAPGGLSQIGALAVEFRANAVVVSIVHLIRVIAVILVAPLVLRLMSFGG